MITHEEWMDLLSYRQMAAAAATWAEIARLAGCDWRTARKYLSAELQKPPRYKPRPPRAKLSPRRDDRRPPPLDDQGRLQLGDRRGAARGQPGAAGEEPAGAQAA
jgi:hypothetical protein